MSLKAAKEEKTDPRVMRTRALLGHAFIDVISKKGFQAVSVQDITGKAGVNRTTFYLHFADKYALLDYTISEYFRQEMDKRLAEADRFTLENLRCLIVALGEFILKANAYCTPAEPQFESLVEAQVKQQLQRRLQAWLAQAEAGRGANLAKAGTAADPVIDTAAASTAAAWAIYGLALQWSHARRRSSAEAFADGVLPLIAPMLGLRRPA
jgi:AcrR family transcriptional regulator